MTQGALDLEGGLNCPPPETRWRPPSSLPDLRKMGRIAVDLETRDGGLAGGVGPGWALRNGHVAGVAVAWDEGSFYAPIDHPDTECMDKAAVGRWLKDHIASDASLVFHNASYDLGWIRAEWGIRPPGMVEDTSIAAVLAYELDMKYSLEACCQRYGVPGKNETALKDAAHAYALKDAKSDLWRLPARYVGEYAEQDAAATLELAKRLDKIIEEEQLKEAYDLERELVAMVHEMRWKGIRVDLDAAERGALELERLRDETFAQLSKLLGEKVSMAEIGRVKWLERVHDAQKIEYPRTAKTGQGSFTSGPTGWMDKHAHWLPQMITKADRLNNAAKKFLRGFILDYASNGRLHPSINQCKGEDGGTRTTRFSYSDPALQQMPARDETIAPMVRQCFLPEEGELWCRPDFSQQEMRLIVHFAEKSGMSRANEAGDRYRKNPDTDYHDMVADMTGLPRKAAKNVNFAKAYGAGEKRFADMTGMTLDQARETIAQYDREVPFVRELSEELDRLAKRRGWVRLIDGARVHFDHWVPIEQAKLLMRGVNSKRDKKYAVEFFNAHDLHNKKLQRPYTEHDMLRTDTRKAANALIQGSAARQTKIAMRDLWRAGVTPLLQLHDEIDCSVATEQEGRLIAQHMMDAVKLTVPVKVDAEYGPNWAEAKMTWAEATGGSV